MFSANTSQVAAGGVNYIEDVFSTYLYTGTGATLTIANGIDLSTKGGMSWSKRRDAAGDHFIQDTVRGASYYLQSNTTNAQGGTSDVTFLTNGYSMGAGADMNISGRTNVNWTFREQPKFFDVVTYTGNGASNRSISHALGSTPGFFVVKPTSTSGSWFVYHRSAGSNGAYPNYLILNGTDSAYTGDPTVWSSAPTSSVINIGSDSAVNNSGTSYVAYIFAHNAGGFGLTGTDNVISCGTFTTDGSSNATITLGYEPQWVLTKRTDGGGGAWGLYDTMRGWSYSAQNYLLPNDSGAEGTINSTNFKPTATGFTIGSPYDSSATYIYIAIRRGPMKVPTSGTSVYQANTYTGNATANTTVAGNFGFPVDLLSLSNRSADATNWATYGHYMIDRLRGQDKTSGTANSNAESAGWSTYNAFDVQNSIGWGLYGASSNTGYMNYSGGTYVARGFRRAPSFFDEVCYTGNDTIRTLNHNLTVAPELIIVKGRNTTPANTNGWTVYAAPLGNTKYLYLNQTNASATFTGYWNDTTPTASVFTLGTGNAEDTNATGKTYVAYLFATCAGVSKVGSYTGNGTTQTINCGFTGGARFVLIKRTNDTGDWRVWDTARGMVAGTDPNLFLNTTDAEANVNAVYTTTGGFQIVATGTGINASGSTYLFLAIA